MDTFYYNKNSLHNLKNMSIFVEIKNKKVYNNISVL